jgi:hypothetical protein
MPERKHISTPQTAILNFIQELKPGLKIEEEFHIGDRLRLDIYLPDIGCAIEYHGRQHFTFVKHFHKTLTNFQDMLARDKTKAEKCKELGIRLIVFSFEDKITKELVETIFNSPPLPNFADPTNQLETKKDIRLKQEKQRRQEKYKLSKTLTNKKPIDQKLKEQQKEYKRKEYRRVKELLKRNKEK